jgi:hypothetical protein
VARIKDPRAMGRAVRKRDMVYVEVFQWLNNGENRSHSQ